MRAAKDHGKIAPEEYSIPHCSYVAHGINLRLEFYYQRYLQQSFSVACSDIKSCYDRIFQFSARLSLQHTGIPLVSIISMLDTIQRMSHMVRTIYGDSNITYGGDSIPDEFMHFMMVLCQGNNSAPQIWSIISSVLFSELRNQGFGIHIIEYFKTEIAQLVGFNYVDECNMI